MQTRHSSPRYQGTHVVWWKRDNFQHRKAMCQWSPESLMVRWAGIFWGHSCDRWQGTAFPSYKAGAQRILDRAFLPTCSAGEKLRGQYGSFMPVFPLRAKKGVAKLSGEEGCFVSPLPQHWEGVGRAGPSGQTTARCHCCKQCPTQPQVSQLISEKPENCDGCLCYWQNTALSSLSPAAPRNPSADKTKAMPPTKGRKILPTIYISIYTHIYSSSLLSPQNFR